PNPRGSRRARATRVRRSSSPSGCRVSRTHRDSSGEITEKYGFSVVAASRVTVRSSTAESSESCWVRLNRCTSSMNSTVGGPPDRRRARAASMTDRTSLTPALRADIATNTRSVARATRWAMVLLPLPAGPHRMTDGGLGPLTSCRRGAPGASRCSCPTSSASSVGRSRTGSGASAAGGSNPPAEPVAPGTAKSASCSIDPTISGRPRPPPAPGAWRWRPDGREPPAGRFAVGLAGGSRSGAWVVARVVALLLPDDPLLLPDDPLLLPDDPLLLPADVADELFHPRVDPPDAVVQEAELLLDPVEPTVDLGEPLIDLSEPLVDLGEPLIDLSEPLVDP